MNLRSLFVLLVGFAAVVPGPPAVGSAFSREGWGLWWDVTDPAARGRGGTSVAISESGASGSLNPAAIGGADFTTGIATYGGEIYSVRGDAGSFRQRQDYLPQFGGVICLPRGVRLGGLFRMQTEAAYERVEPLGGGGEGAYERRTRASGGWNRLQVNLAGPAIGGRVLWGGSLGYTQGTVKEEVTFVFDPSEGRRIRFGIEGRLRGAWTAAGGLIVQPDPRVSIGACGSVKATSIFDERTRVLEGAEASHTQRGKQEVPAEWAVGIAARPAPRLRLSGDIARTLWGDAGLRAATGEPKTHPYDDALRWGIGAEFFARTAPQKRRTWALRAGYSRTELYVRTVDDEKIVERAGSLGMRLGAGRGRAAIDASLEYGTRGDRGTAGIDERFARLSLGVTFGSVVREY